MGFSIVTWNVLDNIPWFVRLSDTGTAVEAKLYKNQADAVADNTSFASQTGPYGLSIEMTFSGVLPFLDSYAWHAVFSGLEGDETTIFRVNRFVEGDEISNALFRNALLSPIRALEEIDAHSMMTRTRTLVLGVHFPLLESGVIASVSNSRRGRDTLGFVSRNEIVYNLGDDGSCSLVNQVQLNEWVQLRR